MYLQNLFPVTIGKLKNPNHLKIENSLIKECSEIKNKTKKGEIIGMQIYIIHLEHLI